jgi:indole-3-acetate monooxygenase
MKLNVDSALVDRARAVVPVIRAHAQEAERERQLSAPVVEAMTQAGLLRLHVPRSLGGLEADIVTCARIAEEVSSSDSAVGWMLVVAGDAWFCSRLPDAGAEEIYADGPDAFIASSFQPPMHARAVAGGYRIGGEGKIASNIRMSTWVMVIAHIIDDDQPRTVDGGPQVLIAFLRTRDCRILDTWYSLGMRATDSNSIVADDIFVPSTRTFPVAAEFQPGAHYHGPLYRAPGTAIVAAWATIGLAVAGDAIGQLRDLAQRKTPGTEKKALRERASTQARLGLAYATLGSARTFLYDALAVSWERIVAGERASLAHKTDLLLAGAHAMQSSARVVELMHSAAGTTGTMTGSRLERHFRDIQTLRHHGLYAEGRYETAGMVALNLPPDLGLFLDVF